MYAKVAGDPMAILCSESLPAPKTDVEVEAEFELAVCVCCGLTEECTPAYTAKVRERYQGRWMCGLCSEAVKDEMCRSGRLIGMEEAINRHIAFCKKFSSAAPSDSTEHLISAMRQLLRRSLDSPRSLRSMPASPRTRDGDGRRKLARSGSCFPRLEE